MSDQRRVRTAPNASTSAPRATRRSTRRRTAARRTSSATRSSTTLWERQHWAVQDLDFTQDRIDWHERFSEEERYQRMYGMSAFFVGEQRVAAELGPIMRAVPDEEMRIFLCTQIADEARHVAFFDRFYAEVGILEANGLEERLAATSEHLNPEFGELFDEMLHRRVDRLAVEPDDLEALVEAITIYHMVLEGMLALTGQHFIIDYNERMGTLPGFVDGLHERRPRRAPPRRVRRALPARHGARATRATARRSSARSSRSRRPPTACCGPVDERRRRTTTVIFGVVGARDARVRDEGARAAAEGHRARGGGVGAGTLPARP